MPLLTSWVGRNKIPYPVGTILSLMAREGTKSLPLAPSAREKEICTFTRGVRYFIPPLPTVEVRYILINLSQHMRVCFSKQKICQSRDP